MSRLELILVVFLAVILIAYMSFISFLMFKIYKDHQSKKHINNSSSTSLSNLSSPFQTDFFNKSSDHAEKVLFNRVFIQEYGEPGYYGNKLMDVIYKLNDETKKSIITAIKFMSIEQNMTRSNENKYRMMAVQERVPVWFVILREATKKVVPDFIQTEQQNDTNNVVPIYRVA